MTIPDSIVQRYQWGGDIYVRLANEYGYPVANNIADAAATGDGELLNLAIQDARYGRIQDGFWDTTGGQFLEILATDPLTAPLQALNNGIKQIVNNSGIRTIATLAVVAVVVVLIVAESRS